MRVAQTPDVLKVLNRAAPHTHMFASFAAQASVSGHAQQITHRHLLSDCGKAELPAPAQAKTTPGFGDAHLGWLRQTSIGMPRTDINRCKAVSHDMARTQGPAVLEACSVAWSSSV